MKKKKIPNQFWFLWLQSTAIFFTNIPLKISVMYYECITFYIHISIQYLESHNISIECFQIF